MLVAVTCDRRRPPRAPGPRPPVPEVFVAEAVVAALRAAGAEPVLLPPGARPAALDGCAALVVTGGAFDIHPRHYGEPVRARLDRVDEERTASELALARTALERGLPVLGICGGMQLFAVATVGSLVQDIAAEVPGALEHEQPTPPDEPWHEVRLEPGLARAALGGATVVRVNSTHHQAVRDPGAFRVSGRAPDGVVEAIELPGHPFALGLQWHPERIDPAPLAALVDAARRGLPARGRAG